jgi:small subunit ribosomal protein S17
MKEGRKQLVGRVTSNKMDKTVVVLVERQVRHSLYGKVVRRTKKYKAHDEHNECQIGDEVRIVESRPFSREKRWCVIEIIERAGQVA